MNCGDDGSYPATSSVSRCSAAKSIEAVEIFSYGNILFFLNFNVTKIFNAFYFQCIFKAAKPDKDGSGEE